MHPSSTERLTDADFYEKQKNWTLSVDQKHESVLSSKLDSIMY